MSIWLITLISFAVVLILSPALFILYCRLTASESKHAKTALSIISKIFYLALAIMILVAFGSYLHSCSVEEYNRGYEAGYEAGIEKGIAKVKEDPANYLDW